MPRLSYRVKLSRTPDVVIAPRALTFAFSCARNATAGKVLVMEMLAKQVIKYVRK
jgi:hypothetical protein